MPTPNHLAQYAEAQAIAALLLLLPALGQVTHTLLDEKREIEASVAAVRAVLPEGLVSFESYWLCQKPSVDPKCTGNGTEINEKYGVGNFKEGKIHARLQLATGAKYVRGVGADRPRVQVERPWLAGDSVAVVVKVRPGKRAAPGDTLTTLHRVVLSFSEGRVLARSVTQIDVR